MACVIREARYKDAPAISLVVQAALRETNAQDYSQEIIDQVVRSFSPAEILRFLASRRVYVACVEDRIVATGSLAGDVIRSVFVNPNYQRQGVGRHLMTTIESVAAQNGVETLRVPSSITAQGFYLSLGFEKVRDEFHGAERTIVMEKVLGQ
jgi:N-acetylglutamate synthase-like GNAT family acetyltransferase